MTTRIHHLSCATMCPAAGRIPALAPARLVAHCLLVEGDNGLTLVDTGFGTADVADPSARLGRSFVLAVGARLSHDETAVAQVTQLGYDPGDVRDIVVTHLDADHAGGLSDFPDARVHVHDAELTAARSRSTALARRRYRPQQWAHGPRWQTHTAGGDRWYDFDSVRAVGDDVVMVPLFGHTLGHCGVAVRRPSASGEADGWFLHAGDAYFSAGEKDTPPRCPPGMRIFQRLMQSDGPARLANQARLRDLHARHGAEVTVFSAHDAAEYAALGATTD